MTRELLDKADKAVASARLLLAADDTDGATNRACYGMFDAAAAALQWAGIGSGQSYPKTHSGLIGSFELHLVQTGRLSAALGRSLNRFQELRLIADYLAEPVPADKARWAKEEAGKFVAAVRALLAQPRA